MQCLTHTNICVQLKVASFGGILAVKGPLPSLEAPPARSDDSADIEGGG